MTNMQIGPTNMISGLPSVARRVTTLTQRTVIVRLGTHFLMILRQLTLVFCSLSLLL